MGDRRFAAFISYKRLYAPWVRLLKSNLERCLKDADRPGNVFVDAIDIGPGQSWPSVIQAAYESSDYLVVISTPEAHASKRVKSEVNGFNAAHEDWEERGRLQIVRLVDTDASPFPKQVQSIDFTATHDDPEAYRAKLRELLAGLLGHRDKRDLPALPPHVAIPGPEIFQSIEDARQAHADGRYVSEGDVPDLPLPAAHHLLRDAVLGLAGPAEVSAKTLDAIVRSSPPSEEAYRLGRIARWSSRSYRLDKRFVRLTLLADQGETSRGERWKERREFHDLRDVLQELPDTAFVLLGPPGSGKSTLLRRLELDTAVASLQRDPAQTEQSPVTFFVPLNTYRVPRDGGVLPLPGPWLAQEWAKQCPELPGLHDLLGQGRVTLLLDAVNEMPHLDDEDYLQRIVPWRELLADLHGRFPGNRVVLSCRTLDYSAPLSSDALPVPQIRVEAFTPEQVREFISLHVPRQADRLWRRLETSSLLELVSIPYFLKLLVDEVAATDEIPRGRAELFTGFVRRALRREVERDSPDLRPDALLDRRDRRKLTLGRWKSPHDLPSRGLLVPELAALADGMQRRRPTGEAAQVRVDHDEALGLVDGDHGEPILRAGIALGVLDEDPGRDELQFFHQLLQEYFAARRQIDAWEPELVRSPWRADDVEPRLNELLVQLADSDPLPAPPATGWEETMLLAAAMARDPDAFVRDLSEANLALAARCAAQPDAVVSRAVKDRVRRALIDRTHDSTADLRARIDAGLALGRIGDPRFERHDGSEGAFLLPPLVEIDGGTYRIGSDDGHKDEQPIHEVELRPFEIGRFAVTNAEWQCYVAAGGPRPSHWNDEAFNAAAQPVVGINWEEARAYCDWLNRQRPGATGRFRLPTEVEWEAAARGREGRIYAYRGEFDASKCNVRETHVRRPTPIDVFPEGRTPQGVADLTGNVREWTSSLYEPYPYETDDGREEVSEGGRRVLRGGSWNFVRDFARAACRYGYYGPRYRYDLIGFRLLCSSPISLDR